MERGGAEQDEPDGAVVRRVVADDVDAFEILVDRHAPRIQRLVARNVPRTAVPEVAHEAFVAAYLSLSSYVETSPFEHWLARIALRCCAEYWRARARDARAIESEAEPVAPPVGDERDLCEWALGRLEREDREVLALVYFAGLTMKECADVLAWSESKVKVRAHRARVRLRRILRRVLPEQGRRS